jgi:RNA polymerase sigma-70 factor (ECF subfamily)
LSTARDVLGFSAQEAAESLQTTVASVNSALQRARNTVDEPEQSQQTMLRALGDQRVRVIVEQYVDAWERGDVNAIAAMLAEDATFAMPPYPAWWRGREVIASFAADAVHRYLPTHANASSQCGVPMGFERGLLCGSSARGTDLGRRPGEGDDRLHDAGGLPALPLT